MDKAKDKPKDRPPAEPYFASAKSTGGGGFNHEDEVAAYFLAHLLTGRMPFGPDVGTIVRIDFQTKPDGWLLDDVLLTLNAGSETHKRALSIKSNPQFANDHAAPADFVSDAWTLYLGGPPMDRERDGLLLAVSSVPADVLRNFDVLHGLAAASDPDTLAAAVAGKGYADDGKRRMFVSFACPAEIAAKFNAGDVPTARLIARLSVIDFDFPSAASRDRAEAVQICRDALADPAGEAAARLWADLCGITRELRPHKGMLDLGRMLKRLRGRHDLRLHPDFRADWAKLDRHARAELGHERRWCLGGRLCLTRLGVRPAIDDLQARNDGEPGGQRVLAFVGDSGDGKSVCGRHWLGASPSGVWLDARLLEGSDGRNPLCVLEQRIGLSRHIEQLLPAATGRRPRLVLDGVNRLFDAQALGAAATLAGVAAEAGWEVALTCQDEHWERVAATFRHAGLAPRPVRVGPLNEEELTAVAMAEPRIAGLLARDEVRRVLARPKYLDVVLGSLPTDSSMTWEGPTAWTGEADVAWWCWQQLVEGPSRDIARSVAAKHLASVQADTVRDSVADDQIEPAHLPAVRSLLQDGVCRRVGERVVFDHDLLGDWARATQLAGRSDDLLGFLKANDRSASPLWLHALRFWALDVLERQNDVPRWVAAVRAFSTAGEHAAADRILEAVLLSARASVLIDQAWPELVAGDGLLRRALRGFLHAATVPDLRVQSMIPQVAGVAGGDQGSLATWAAANLRVPVPGYWLVVLPVLFRRRTDIARFAPREAAQISRLWLRHTPEDMPLRQAAAAVALAAGWRVHATMDDRREPISLPGGASDWSLCHDAEEDAYSAVLAAVAVLPSQAVDLALHAAGRRGGVVAKDGEVYDPPWTHGPVRRVSERFRTAVLDEHAFVPLVRADAKAAAEVLLAVLIDEPQLRAFPGMSGLFGRGYDDDRDLCVASLHQWLPPFYTRGPFLAFLRISPEPASDAIVELVNFATERWADRQARVLHGRRDGQSAVSVHVDEGGQPNEWLGDIDVCDWHTGDVPAPRPVTSALMALEKWLYERLDAGDDVTAFVDRLTRRAKSVAIAGMLGMVLRYSPQLLAGPLAFFLRVPEFLFWEPRRRSVRSGAALLGWSLSLRQGRQVVDAAKEWFAMPHRQADLLRYLYTRFLSDDAFRARMSATLPGWRNELSRNDLPPERREAIKDFVASFDIDRWETVSLPAGGQAWKRKQSADETLAGQAVLRRADDTLLAVQFPHRCRELLDGKASLDDAGLDTFWAQLNRVAELLAAAGEPDKPTGSDAAEIAGNSDYETTWRRDSFLAGVFGGIGVLVLRHSEWLETRRGHKAWLLRLLRRATRLPPPPTHPMDAFHPDETSDDRWQCFYAQIVVAFWCRKPASKSWRHEAAVQAFGFHYTPVRQLFAAAFERRGELKGGFEALCHILLRWAGVRWHANLAKHNLPINVDVTAEGHALLAAFVNGDLPPQWPTCRASADAPAELPERTPPPPVWRRGLDLSLIAAAFTRILRPADAVSEDERTRWIAFWLDLAGWRLAALSETGDENDTHDGTPSASDDWLLERLADVTITVRPEERPEEAWRLPMAVGAARCRWTESFLTSFLIQGLSADPVPPSFTRCWSAMIRFAETSPAWSSANDQTWAHLLGFDRLVRGKWEGRHAALLRTLLPHLTAFVRTRLASISGLLDLVAWLKWAAVERVGLDLLTSIADAIATQPSVISLSRGTSTAVAEWITGLLQDHLGAIRSSPDLFDALIRLLVALANVQEPLARELQDRLRRH